jgi:hypothetical protein
MLLARGLPKLVIMSWTGSHILESRVSILWLEGVRLDRHLVVFQKYEDELSYKKP